MRHRKKNHTTTIPARDSFEERQFELVHRGILTISDAQKNVERRRELRNASAAVLIGGLS